MFWVLLLPVYLLFHYADGGTLFTRQTMDQVSHHSLPACLLVKYEIIPVEEIICAKVCAKKSGCKYFLYDTRADWCLICVQTKDYSDLQSYEYISHSQMMVTNAIYFKVESIDACQPSGVCIPRNCGEYREQGYHQSGEYLVLSPTSTHGETLTVYCDMSTDDGGWMVFQRRLDGSVDFYKNWADYEGGFGNISHEFWMGSQYIAAFTQQNNYEMRVDMADFDGTFVYASYYNFTVDPNDLYRMNYDLYSGNIGDSLELSKGHQFSTFDNDHDTSTENCASKYKGAWWYHKCHRSNLNGLYLSGPVSSFADGVTWKSFRDQYYSLKFTEMKIRPLDFIPPKALYSHETDLPPPGDCADLRNRGVSENGVHSVHVQHLGQTLDVYCDMETAGGGWLVFQRRQDGSEDFYRGWANYETGFGDLLNEFWLGNDKIASITEQKSYELRVDLSDFDSGHKYASYKAFALDRNSNYRLRVDYYSGDAGDSLAYSNGQQWTTYDRDNDLANDNCAVRFKGAWWHDSCHHSNLNGLYLSGNHGEFAIGVNWKGWRGYHYSLKSTEMKIRPAGYKTP